MTRVRKAGAHGLVAFIVSVAVSFISGCAPGERLSESPLRAGLPTRRGTEQVIVAGRKSTRSIRPESARSRGSGFVGRVQPGRRAHRMFRSTLGEEYSELAPRVQDDGVPRRRVPDVVTQSTASWTCQRP